MQIINEKEATIMAQWRTYTSVQRWSDGLLQVTGLTLAEVENRLDILFQFCMLRGFDPEEVAMECRHSPDRLARRTYYLQIAQESSSNLIFQSYLVHNGVNIFGDLICMPSTQEQVVAEQGKQWAPHVELHLDPQTPLDQAR
jgi:hypothetical protein